MMKYNISYFTVVIKKTVNKQVSWAIEVVHDYNNYNIDYYQKIFSFNNCLYFFYCAYKKLCCGLFVGYCFSSVEVGNTF